jgi:tRNA pseudouridine38-40 synthase
MDAESETLEPSAKRPKLPSANNEAPSNENAKRKVAVLVAYNGIKYSGLQKNPDVSTVEEVLEQALHRAGGISDDNVGSLQKVSWSRCGRTDKGVHALGQIISVKLVLTPEGLLQRVNGYLTGTDISVLAIERASNNFCAHTACSSREYEYLLPTSVLRQPAEDKAGPPAAAAAGGEEAAPSSASAAAGPSDVSPLTEAECAKLLALFKTFEGTHRFHNFTDGKLSIKDKAAQRYMLSMKLGEQITLDGVAYVPLRLHGQSFLLHQIRKMVGLLVATFRGDVPPDAISTALSAPKVCGIPMAPSCALILRRCLFAEYERRRTADRGSLHFPACEAAKQAFLREHILPHVATCAASGEFGRFSRTIAGYQLERVEAPSAEEEDGASAGAARPDPISWAAACAVPSMM